MKISYDWLKDYIDIDLSVEKLADELTSLGLEVESIEYPNDFSDVVIGLVESVEPVAGSKNKFCRVNVGDRKLDIICGAPNVREGMLAPSVLPGGSLPGGKKIDRAVIFGLESEGMLCSQSELMLGRDSSGIWELNEYDFRHIKAEPGADLRTEFPMDVVFKLEITQNRPDCLSHYGVARDLAASLGLKLKKIDFKLNEISKPAIEKLDVEILDAEKCPRYAGRLIEGITVKESPLWMQRRLLAVGLRPISNIVDVTNYVLMELGHPLHAFDFDLVEDNTIIVKRAKDGEKFVTLDEKEHELISEDLLICDGKKAVALAGVMGGLNTEIMDSTTNVLLECAYFQPVTVRRTGKRHGIISDSSYRFERGVDPNAVPFVIDRTASLIRDTAGGEILSGRVDNYIRKIKPVKVNLRPNRVNQILGSKLRADKMIEYLNRLGLEVKMKDKVIETIVPTFRPDITQEIDLVEEIARLHGYNNLSSVTRSSVSLEVEKLDSEDFDDLVRSALVESGMVEVLTHSMRHPQRTGLGFDTPVKIRNPISEDFALLRKGLLAPLLEVTGHNQNHGVESVRIFEMGSVFNKLSDGSIREHKLISGLITGSSDKVHWSHKVIQFDYFSLKGLVENLFDMISVNNYVLTSHTGVTNYYKYAGSAVFNGEFCGDFGLLKNEITEKFDISSPVFVFAFDCEVLRKNHRKINKYSPVSRFPAVKRDLSMVFDADVSAEEIEKALHVSGDEYPMKLRFFDLYKGKQLGAGKKSISVSMHFQSIERTLTDGEIDLTMGKIIKDIEAIGGEIRKQ